MPAEKLYISSHFLHRFCVAGINYHKADAATRGMFSIDPERFGLIAEAAKTLGLRSVFVVSTCNRTEIYGFAESVMQLVDLLVQHTNGNKQAFLNFGYYKNGNEALKHLFNMAAGLDSQILGDYEILGQLKRSVDLSRKHQLIGTVMDRVINFVYQASKKIKTETLLSNGTVSVSFAAIELLQQIKNIVHQKILLIGTGKFGTNICKNLKSYLPQTAVTVMNRTNETARQLAQANHLLFTPYENKSEAIAAADIIIVCTNAAEPTVLPQYFKTGDKKLILDLSVPINVHPDVKNIEGIIVTDVDEISKTILSKTLSKRLHEVPQAEAIIDFYISEFIGWLKEYHYALHLKTWKNKLQKIDTLQSKKDESYNDEQIDENEKTARAQKAIKQLAVNLKVKQDKGCQFINTLNDYLQMN
jgi:glutamyl-tRNA reductase